MNKNEFIQQLRGSLAKLPDYEISKTISFYSEIIDDRVEDGMSEEEAVASLGAIEKIAREIIIDTPLASLIQNKIKESHHHSNHKTLWMVLAICGFPVWLPLGISFVFVILAVYVSIWAVIASLFVVEFSFAIAGLGVLSGFILCFQQSIASGIAMIGLGIASIGIFVMTIKPFFWLCKQFIALTGVFLRKTKTMFISNKEDYQ
jgi:uncharacterized membrane protein